MQYMHSVSRPTTGPANQVLWEAKQVWQNILLLYVLFSCIIVRIIPAINTWCFLMGIDYNNATAVRVYSNSIYMI